MIRPARPASTVCLLRDGADGLEVLMVQRGPSARFMSGAWVFPGGVVEDVDRSEQAANRVAGVRDPEDLPWLAAGLRELAEEAAVWLTDEPIARPAAERPLGSEVYERLDGLGRRFDASRLAYFSNWITPTVIPMRFDTRFYVAVADRSTRPDPDPRELSDFRWVGPGEAIDRAKGGDRTIPFPTLKNLAYLRRFATTEKAMSEIRAIEAVDPIMPRGRVAGDGSVEVVLPWEAGYDDLGDDAPGQVDLAKAARARGADSLAELDSDEG